MPKQVASSGTRSGAFARFFVTFTEARKQGHAPTKADHVRPLSRPYYVAAWQDVTAITEWMIVRIRVATLG
jgi:hypothetical protein